MVRTSEIIQQFMKDRLGHSGFEWNYKNAKQNQESSEVREICSKLDRVSNNLLEFIRQERKEEFEDMTDELISNFQYENFQMLADELFINEINWDHIMSLLVSGSECARKIQELEDLSAKKRNEMVNSLNDWLSNYVVEKLEPWILSQKGGWSSIEDLVPDSNGGMRQYFKMAAIAAICSGLYALTIRLSNVQLV